MYLVAWTLLQTSFANFKVWGLTKCAFCDTIRADENNSLGEVARVSQVFDANGNAVTESTARCSRCGSPIKHVFEYEGKTYGSTCIEVVSGIKPAAWVLVGGKGDERATHKSLADKEAAMRDYDARQAALEVERESIRQANRVRYEELINVLNNASRYRGDFCSEMAQIVSSCGSSAELYDGILSPGQFDAVRDIWGKVVGGRKNSKAYKAAVAEFDEKFDEQE